MIPAWRAPCDLRFPAHPSSRTPLHDPIAHEFRSRRALAWSIHEPQAENASCPSEAGRAIGPGTVVPRTRRGRGRSDDATPCGQTVFAGGAFMIGTGWCEGSTLTF